MRRAVFLDRDGVLNAAIVRDGRPFAPLEVEEFVLLPDAVAGCQALRSGGFLLVVVTNQPEIGRGTLRPDVLEAMNARLRKECGVDAVYVCPHGQDGECDCRKPKPGMLRQAAADLQIDLAHSFLVGDRWRDIECGKAAGCRAVFIDHNYQETRPSTQDATVGNLTEAATWILSRGEESN